MLYGVKYQLFQITLISVFSVRIYVCNFFDFPFLQRKLKSVENFTKMLKKNLLEKGEKTKQKTTVIVCMCIYILLIIFHSMMPILNENSNCRN